MGVEGSGWEDDIIPGREILREEKQNLPDLICSCSQSISQGESLWATVTYRGWERFLEMCAPSLPGEGTGSGCRGDERESLVGVLGGCSPKVNSMPWMRLNYEVAKAPRPGGGP